MQPYEIRIVAICESCGLKKPLSFVVVEDESFYICDDCNHKENN
jgi:hypothetical protein